MSKMLVIVGEEYVLNTIQDLAEEAGATTYWAKPKRKVRPHSRTAHGLRPKHDTRLGQCVLAAMRKMPMRQWNRDEIALALEEAGWCHRSASPTLSMLDREGYARRIATNTYILTALGRGDTAA
jgi:hypothetical protein